MSTIQITERERNMYTEERIERLRKQVIDYLSRNKIAPSSLAIIMQMAPGTLRSFLDLSRKPQFVTLSAVERWLEEYDHADFIFSKKK